MVSSSFYLLTTMPPASGGPGGATPSPSGTKSADAAASSSAMPFDDVHMRPAPRPPPGVDKSQLKTWHAALEWRIRQVHSLKHRYLTSFANDIAADLVSTRYEANECSTDDDDDEVDTNDGADNLAAGLYSSYLLTQQPVLLDLKASDVTLHLVAMFYTSVNDRLPLAVREHAVDAVRRAFEKLEAWLAMSNADEGNVANLLVGLKHKSAPVVDATEAEVNTKSTSDDCKHHHQRQDAWLAKSNAEEKESSALKVEEVRGAVAVCVTKKRSDTEARSLVMNRSKGSSRKKRTKKPADPASKARIDAAILGAKRYKPNYLRGVTMKPSGKWQVQVYHLGKTCYMGTFASKERAVLAYEVARRLLREDGPEVDTDKSLALARRARRRRRKMAFGNR